MPLHVQGKVVRSGEAPVTLLALERFQAGVLAVMSGQLVRAGKAPLATVPRTLVRFLTCNQKYLDILRFFAHVLQTTSKYDTKK